MKQVVIYILDTLQTGGAEKSLLEIVKHFKKYNPVFLQLFKNDELKDEFSRAGIEVVQLNLLKSFHFNELAHEVAKACEGYHPMIVHSTLFHSDLTARALAKKIPVVLVNSWVSNSYSRRRYQGLTLPTKLKLLFLQGWDRYTAKNVSMFVSNSLAIRNSNAKALNVPHSKTRVIFRGRSLQPYDDVSKEAIELVKNQLNINGKSVFINVGRLMPSKGQLDLVRAFAILLQHNPDSVLLIAGDGPFRSTIKDEINRLRIDGQVFLLGNRKDIPLLLKASNYFVFPTYYEGLPGALIEAMFARIPIIASAIPENLECVNEECALLHPVRDINALAHQMKQALEDAHWPKRTQKAFDYALEHFEIRKIAQQYEKLYDSLLGAVGRT